MFTLKYFTNNSLPNCHIELTSEGIIVWASLNIEPGMVKFLSPNNVFKRKMYIYALREVVKEPTIRSVSDKYEELLVKAMIHCREAKQKMLQNQIEIIKFNHNVTSN